MKQIIGVDMASEDSKDFSVVSCICSSCKSIFEVKKVPNEQDYINVPFYKNCPKCGIKFNGRTLAEDCNN